jgi:hypothetical protein
MVGRTCDRLWVLATNDHRSSCVHGGIAKVSFRNHSAPNFRIYDLGFRCAR